jgi:hypothetical protein
MEPIAPILADADALKVIFGIIVAVVWGLGVLAAAAKKKRDPEGQQSHQEQWQRIEQEMRERAARALSTIGQQPGQVPPSLPPRTPVHAPPPPVFAPPRSIAARPVAHRPAPQRPVTQRPMAQRPMAQRPTPPRAAPARPAGQPAPKRPKKQKAARLPTAPPLPPVAASAVVQDVVQAVQATAESASAIQRRGSAANAAALSRWLTPATLRSQFILTEILQPPLALRPPADRDF